LTGFAGLLRSNRNYRFTWSGQVVSEVGDHYNNIAVFSLVLANTGSGLVVAGVLIARGVAVMLAGPIAGVLLDRMDRKRIMIISDLVRGVIALAFLAGIPPGRTWLLYVLSGCLMFASPFFTAGRASILPAIATKDELHTANSLTQLTQWTTVMIGSFLGGTFIAGFGYKFAFAFNALSFLFSAACISRLRLPQGLRAKTSSKARSKAIELTEDRVLRPWHEYTEGLRYMRSTPLILGIGLVSVGWASGGGAAQILFSLFGEQVFNRGPAGIGIIWGFAGIGLVTGALIANYMGHRVGFRAYKLAISICYVIHGGSYVIFSQAPTFGLALVFIAMSRAATAVSSVLNMGQLLRHVPDEFRGRVFSTIETWNWTTMIVSMALAGLASDHVSPRVIGFWSGTISSTTALFWGWANVTGRLREPALTGVEPEEVEVHGDPTL
jgi:MFS family permease